MRRPLALALTLLALTLPARAAVNVGDKPTLAFPSVNGMGQVSLDRLQGKIVIVDFWATWCGPCMAEADHMVKLHKDYGPKGVQLIGVSLDDGAATMNPVAKAKGFDWPQACGPAASALANQYGVTGIPSTFILSPEGVVLWKGHPANIDRHLEEALKAHPPQLVDSKTMAAATAALDKAEAALKDKSAGPAARALAAFPAAAKADAKIADRLAAVQKDLDASAEAALAEVEPMVAAKDYVGAAGKLRDLAAAMGPGPTGDKVRKRLTELTADPAVKAAFEAAGKAKAAEDELAIAKRLQADGKNEQAYARFKSILTTFGTTPAAEQAKSAVAAYEKDPEFVRRASDAAAGTKAKSLMGMAQNYRQAGRLDLAKRKYEEVISTFPNTSYAKDAATAIREMGN